MRIERLWVDVTAQVGSKWAAFFEDLELQHGLDVNDDTHLWLLHQVFLPRINHDLDFFVRSWNHHTIQMRNGPNHSPIDMFGFDMLVHGIRGDQLLTGGAEADEDMTEDELSLYGVDWEVIDGGIHPSEASSGPTSAGQSWVG